MAQQFIEQATLQQQIRPGQLTIHADRGSSMRSKPVAFLLVDLGVTRTHSRPYTSTDKPYSGAQFKTLKYRPGFPDRFHAIESARDVCRPFFRWYNHEHRHSGIALMPPAAVHYGRAEEMHAQRAGSWRPHMRRIASVFVRGVPQPPEFPSAVWINRPATAELAPLK